MKYNYLVLFSAFILAACGALVSVFGLGQLFAGAGIVVKVMVGGLEFGKLVLAATLHRYWGGLHSLLKVPLAFAVVVMMGLTSLGIYGFLSDGYQKTASQYEIESGKTELLENKAARFANRIVENDKIIENKNRRSATLSDLRAQQEVRLDSLYAKNYISNANKVRMDIDAATKEIQILNDDIDGILVENSALADSVGVYKEKIGEVKEASEVTAELGPLIYLSNLSGLEMAAVVNILIFLIMGVFDPTAIGLLILASSILKIEENMEPKVKETKSGWFTGLKNRIKSIKLPKATIPPNETDDEVSIDPETGEFDLSGVELSVNRDIWMGTPADDEPIDIVPPVVPTKPIEVKSTVDKVLELERAKKADKTKRGFSVEVPEPKVLGKTWAKKGGNT